MSRADILIRGGEVIDGSGAPAVAADIAIIGGRIAAIAPKLESVAIADRLGLGPRRDRKSAHGTEPTCARLGGTSDDRREAVSASSRVWTVFDQSGRTSTSTRHTRPVGARPYALEPTQK